METDITEEFENLKHLIGEFIKLSPNFPEEIRLAKEIETSIEKMQGLIDDLLAENRNNFWKKFHRNQGNT